MRSHDWGKYLAHDFPVSSGNLHVNEAHQHLRHLTNLDCAALRPVTCAINPPLKVPCEDLDSDRSLAQRASRAT